MLHKHWQLVDETLGEADGVYIVDESGFSKKGVISRPLYVYTAGEPTVAMKAYLDWVLSDGQAQVSELGFVPLQESAN